MDFDTERAVLCVKTENKSIENYIFQYKNAPLFNQRREAIVKLSAVQNERNAAKEILIAALRDKSPFIRQFALEELAIPKENSTALLDTIAAIAQNDRKSLVRESAINKLGS